MIFFERPPLVRREVNGSANESFILCLGVAKSLVVLPLHVVQSLMEGYLQMRLRTVSRCKEQAIDRCCIWAGELLFNEFTDCGYCFMTSMLLYFFPTANTSWSSGVCGGFSRWLLSPNCGAFYCFWNLMMGMKYFLSMCRGNLWRYI